MVLVAIIMIARTVDVYAYQGLYTDTWLGTKWWLAVPVGMYLGALLIIILGFSGKVVRKGVLISHKIGLDEIVLGAMCFLSLILSLFEPAFAPMALIFPVSFLHDVWYINVAETLNCTEDPTRKSPMIKAARDDYEKRNALIVKALAVLGTFYGLLMWQSAGAHWTIGIVGILFAILLTAFIAAFLWHIWLKDLTKNWRATRSTKRAARDWDRNTKPIFDKVCDAWMTAYPDCFDPRERETLKTDRMAWRKVLDRLAQGSVERAKKIEELKRENADLTKRLELFEAHARLMGSARIKAKDGQRAMFALGLDAAESMWAFDLSLNSKIDDHIRDLRSWIKGGEDSVDRDRLAALKGIVAQLEAAVDVMGDTRTKLRLRVGLTRTTLLSRMLEGLVCSTINPDDCGVQGMDWNVVRGAVTGILRDVDAGKLPKAEEKWIAALRELTLHHTLKEAAPSSEG